LIAGRKMTNKFLIVVVGPTAIGKTILSIEIAKQLNTEIISADSRQFFRELNIGTAKPLPQELSQIKHHFINSHSISQNYNVGMFETEAISFIDNFFKTNNTLLLTGGSGLYIDAVCKGIDDFPPADALLREELTNNLKKNGIADIQNLLKKLDFIHYEKADLSNPHRIIRALEVCLLTGKPYSSFRKNTAKKRNFNILKIGLTVERNQLYEKINQRVDAMMQQGLLQEVEHLIPYKNNQALQTVGYKELFDYLDNKIDLQTAINLIKQNTRRYAKRQLTWFRKDAEINWFSPAAATDVMNHINAKLY